MSLLEIQRFQKELKNFGIEVIKFPKTGSPLVLFFFFLYSFFFVNFFSFSAARTIFLNIEPKRLYWVGKGGRSSIFELEPNLVINRGRFGSEGNPVSIYLYYLFNFFYFLLFLFYYFILLAIFSFWSI